MIDFSQNYFALFGLPQRYGFDPEQLDAAYRALQRVVHPDRYAAAGDAERRVALQSSARVNEAYRALKDPVGRAQYLLTLRGIDALAETNTALPAEFLQHELERRDARYGVATMCIGFGQAIAGVIERLCEVADEILIGEYGSLTGGIATFASVGAEYGYQFLWLLIPLTISLGIVQEMCARMGAVTGKGLSDLIREEFGFRVTF
mgnify:CR=1 FL=1